MFLRHHTKRKSGKPHTYWSVVRSVRVGGKVRQEVVAYLGELDGDGRAKASSLARHFLGKKAESPSLFESSPLAEPVKVIPSKVRVERSRQFGEVWMA